MQYFRFNWSFGSNCEHNWHFFPQIMISWLVIKFTSLLIKYFSDVLQVSIGNCVGDFFSNLNQIKGSVTNKSNKSEKEK